MMNRRFFFMYAKTLHSALQNTQNKEPINNQVPLSHFLKRVVFYVKLYEAPGWSLFNSTIRTGKLNEAVIAIVSYSVNQNLFLVPENPVSCKKHQVLHRFWPRDSWV